MSKFSRGSRGTIALGLFLSLAAVSCSDDPVETAESVDAAPGEEVSDLACLNAFESVAADEADLAVTLEACETRAVWEGIADDFPGVLQADAETPTTLDDLCEAATTDYEICE